MDASNQWQDDQSEKKTESTSPPCAQLATQTNPNKSHRPTVSSPPKRSLPGFFTDNSREMWRRALAYALVKSEKGGGCQSSGHGMDGHGPIWASVFDGLMGPLNGIKWIETWDLMG